MKSSFTSSYYSSENMNGNKKEIRINIESNKEENNEEVFRGETIINDGNNTRHMLFKNKDKMKSILKEIFEIPSINKKPKSLKNNASSSKQKTSN